jgi:DNA-binding NtrC family response regulator
VVSSVIILADDDLSMREALAAALETHGFEVMGASSGVEAVRLATSCNAEAIISDVSMTGGDGFDVLAAKARGDLDVPVIVLSGHAEAAVKSKALEVGAAAYLLKPISVPQLMTAVTRVLEGRRR